MAVSESNIDVLVAELRSQGLTVTMHSALNETWYIRSEGSSRGCVASSDELVELRRSNLLTLRGIKSLG